MTRLTAISISVSGLTIAWGGDHLAAASGTQAGAVGALVSAPPVQAWSDVVQGVADGLSPGSTFTTYVPGAIAARGTELTLGGQPYRFVGLNAYELATDWGTNYGCGQMLSDGQLDRFFASLPPNSLVRFWAFQALAVNEKTKRIDWTPIDRVFTAAASHHERLIVTLANQGGTCDGEHWQDPAWYLGGFRDVFNSASISTGAGYDPLSYWNYLQLIVSRYRNSPALGMWEPMSEAEASTCPPQSQPTDCSGHQICPDEAVAAHALRYFFDTVGGEIHALDPEHLVEDGLLGSGQCGTQGADYAYVSQSPGIDVLSFHDYSAPVPGPNGSHWATVDGRLDQATAVDKPVIAGELGVEASPSGAGCTTLAGRSSDIVAKLKAEFARGLSGALIWDWETSPETTGCTYNTYPGDPLLRQLSSLLPRS